MRGLMRVVRGGSAVTGALARAAAVEVLVRAAPLPRFAPLLGVALEPSGAETGARSVTLTDRDRRRVRAALLVSDGWPGAGRCLPDALALGWALRRRRPVLRIGVRPGGAAERFAAHAWIEVGGCAYDPTAWRWATLEPAGGR